jgi:hypothetical protein
MSITPPPTPIPSRDDPNNFDPRVVAILTWLATFVPEANTTEEQMNEYAATAQAAAASAVASPNTQATSTTSLAIATGSKNPTIQSGKSFSPSMWVAITSTADGTNWMAGPVTSYSGTSLVVDVQRTGGSGTFTSWTVVGIQPMISDATPRALAAGSTVKDTGGTDRLIGFRGILKKTINSAYTVTPDDVGYILEIVSGGSITFPKNSTQVGAAQFSPHNSSIVIQNTLATTVTLTQASGCSLVNVADGTTGNKTLKAKGRVFADLGLNVADTWYIGGSI